MSFSHFAISAFVLATPSWSVRQLPPTASFREYTDFFGRAYSHDSEEGKLRQTLFEQRVLEVRRQNEKRGALWQAGLNAFTDWTHDELQSMQGWRPTSPNHRASLGLMEQPADTLPSNFPTSKEWNLQSLAVPQDQGSCGSCWAVATTYLLRAHYEIQTSTVKKFAIQGFLNCVENPMSCGGTGGCSGATVELALGYVQNVSLANLPLDTDLPYTASDGECSKASWLAKSRPLRGVRQQSALQVEDGISLAGYSTLPANRPVPLLLALLNGPVAVSAAAGQWFSYTSGVFDGCKDLGDWVINHAILMVGFGVDDSIGSEESGTKYWTILNSWGASWGEEGKMRLLRETPEKDAENCGWDEKPEDGIACKPYPKRSWACGTCGILFDSVTPQINQAK